MCAEKLLKRIECLRNEMTAVAMEKRFYKRRVYYAKPGIGQAIELLRVNEKSERS